MTPLRTSLLREAERESHAGPSGTMRMARWTLAERHVGRLHVKVTLERWCFLGARRRVRWEQKVFVFDGQKLIAHVSETLHGRARILGAIADARRTEGN